MDEADRRPASPATAAATSSSTSTTSEAEAAAYWRFCGGFHGWCGPLPSGTASRRGSGSPRTGRGTSATGGSGTASPSRLRRRTTYKMAASTAAAVPTICQLHSQACRWLTRSTRASTPEEIERRYECFEGNYICIAGGGSVGKTIIARRVYDHPSVVTSFRHRLWINLGGSHKEPHILAEEIKQKLFDAIETTMRAELDEWKADERQRRGTSLSTDGDTAATEGNEIRFLLLAIDAAPTEFFASQNDCVYYYVVQLWEELFDHCQHPGGMSTTTTWRGFITYYNSTIWTTVFQGFTSREHLPFPNVSMPPYSTSWRSAILVPLHCICSSTCYTSIRIGPRLKWKAYLRP